MLSQFFGCPIKPIDADGSLSTKRKKPLPLCLGWKLETRIIPYWNGT